MRPSVFAFFLKQHAMRISIVGGSIMLEWAQAILCTLLRTVATGCPPQAGG